MLAAGDFATKASKNERDPGTLWSCPTKYLEKLKKLTDVCDVVDVDIQE